MTSHRLTDLQFRAGAVVALAGLALLVAGCGSSSNSGTTGASTSSNKPAAHAVGLTISTAHGSAGTYLTGAGGRAVYLFASDTPSKSTCTATCAQNWPPLIARATPKAGSGVTAANLTMITRSGGVKQVAYKGHPLYYYIGDSGSGQTNGQGSSAYGAKWWLVSPAGAAITSGGSSSGGSSSGGYGSGGGY